MIGIYFIENDLKNSDATLNLKINFTKDCQEIKIQSQNAKVYDQRFNRTQIRCYQQTINSEYTKFYQNTHLSISTINRASQNQFYKLIYEINSEIKTMYIQLLILQQTAILLFFYRQSMSSYQQNSFGESYKQLQLQYNRDEQKLLELQKEINQRKFAHNNFKTSMEIARNQLQGIIDSYLYRNQMSDEKKYRKELQIKLEDLSNDILRLTQIQERGAKNQRELGVQIQQLQSKLEIMKKKRNSIANNGLLQQIWSMDQRIRQIQASIYQIQSAIDQKNQAKNTDNKLEQALEQLRDFEKLEVKLKEQLALKQAQENIQKQKLVIEHGKLTNLQNQHLEREQTYKSLVKHHEQIKQRVAALKKQKKMLVKEQEKQKYLPTKYPVRQEISIFERENQLLEKELEREKQKLRDYQESKTYSISQAQMQEKKRKFEELKIQEIKIKQQIQENKSIKEELKRLEEEFNYIKQIEESMIKEKKKKLNACIQKANEYQSQKQKIEAEIESMQGQMQHYAKIYHRNQQIRKSNMNRQNQKNKTINKNIRRPDPKKENELQEKAQERQGNPSYFDRFKEDVLVSFNDWTTNLQLNRQNMISYIVLLAVFVLIISMLSL